MFCFVLFFECFSALAQTFWLEFFLEKTTTTEMPIMTLPTARQDALIPPILHKLILHVQFGAAPRQVASQNQ